MRPLNFRYSTEGVNYTETVTLNAGQILWALICASSIPSAVFGLLIWNFQRKITNRDKQKEKEEERLRKEAEEREANREQLEVNIVQCTWAAIALGEATARAVQRIPDAHCNGDMHSALEYATKVKHEQKEFLTKKGIHALVD